MVYDRIGRPAVVALLRQHLTANLVKLRREWYRQSLGIPQGSTLSTLLCSIYLAHVERTHLRPAVAAALQQAPPAAGTAGARPGSGAAASLATSSRGMLTALAAAAAEDSTHGSAAAAHSERTTQQQQWPTQQQQQQLAIAGGVQRGSVSQPQQVEAQEQQPLLPGWGPFRTTLLLRLVDDFLLVTSVPAVAAAVAERMLRGKEVVAASFSTKNRTFGVVHKVLAAASHSANRPAFISCHHIYAPATEEHSVPRCVLHILAC